MSEIKYDIISTESGDYKTTLNRSFLNRKTWVPNNPKRVVSFMPGSVVEYTVKVGDDVKKGDLLLIFKAMKMSNKVLAPLDGKVKSLDAEIGVNIAKNILMIELE